MQLEIALAGGGDHLGSVGRDGVFNSRPSIDRCPITSALRQHLISSLRFSLERVRTAEDGLAIETPAGPLVGDVWVDVVSRNPSRTRRVMEPGVVVEVVRKGDCNPASLNRIQAFRSTSSIQELMIVYAQKRAVEVWRRVREVEWVLDEFGWGQAFELRSIGVGGSVEGIFESAEIDVVARVVSRGTQDVQPAKG